MMADDGDSDGVAGAAVTGLVVTGVAAASIKETVAHEEEMINRRLSWMLTLQGFLYAAVGLADGNSLQNAISGVGILTSFVTLLGVVAAYAAIDHVREEAASKEAAADEAKPLKNPSFGSTRWPKWLGRTNAYALPAIVALSWMYILSL